MLRFLRVNVFRLLFLAGFFAVAVVNHATRDFVPRPTADVLFCALFIAWTLSLQRRILHTVLRRALAFLGVLTVLLLVLRVLRNKTSVMEMPALSRSLWYLFYFPFLFLPAGSLFASLSLGTPEDSRVPGRQYAVLLPGAALLALVLTNDLHRLVFRGVTIARVGYVYDFVYGYGPVYYVLTAYVALCMLLSVLIAMRRSTLSAEKRLFLLPAVGPAVYVLWYCSAFLLPGAEQRHIILNVPEMYSLMFFCLWETCIGLGLVPSNSGYERFFHLSHVSAVIEDEAGRPVYEAGVRAPENPADVVYHEKAISGGHVRWAQDVSDFNRVQAQLREANERLAEEADLIAAENRLKEASGRVEAQSRIYDLIDERTRTQTSEVSRLISEAERSPAQRDALLKKACLLTAYVKRTANISLLEPDSGRLSSGELTLALGETLDYLRRTGIPSGMRADGTTELKKDEILAAYAAVERLIEESFDALSGVWVRTDASDGRLVCRVQLETPRAPDLSSLPGNAAAKTEDGVVYVTMAFGEVRK